jgi:hypothetical protein
VNQKILDEKSGSELSRLAHDRAKANQLTQSARTRNFAADSSTACSATAAMSSPFSGKISNSPSRLRAFWLALIVLLLSCATLPAAEDIPPPFGFHWNDSMTKLEQVLVGAKAKIVSRDRKEKRETWTVEGLVQPGLRRTLFTFRDGFLVEVELQYEYPDWTIERYNERMGEIRRYFDAKFGTGKLVSRSRDTDSDVIQTLVGYQWIVGGTMLELFYFSAQRDKDLFRSITVSYKAI